MSRPPRYRHRRSAWLAWLPVGWPVGLAIVALLGWRLVLINAAPLRAVELQQAHLAWSWNQGWLPYRDVMDLYPPLLGWWLRLPLSWLGQQASVLTWLRVASLPWYAVSLWALWSIGRRVYGAAAGLVGMLLVGLFPSMFTVMGQVGIDGMWCALVLAALAVLVGRRPQGLRGRALLAGVLAGLALCVSLKMIWLLTVLAMATIAVALRRLGDRAVPALRPFGWGLAGLLLPPLLALIWLGAHGALPTVLSWLPEEALGEGGLAAGWRLAACLLLAALGMAWLCLRPAAAVPGAQAAWRLFLALCAWLDLSLVVLAWPWYSRPDLAPLMAISGLAISGELACRPGWQGRRGWLACLWLLMIEGLCIGWSLPPDHDALRAQRANLAAVLRYSAPGDRVMDAYGESVFRRRAYYPYLGAWPGGPGGAPGLPDNVADELVRNGIHLVVRRFLAPWSDSFVARNYLHLGGTIYVAGRSLDPTPGPDGGRSLALEVPGDYVLTDGVRAVVASMDGQPAASRWRLAVGRHLWQTPVPTRLWLVDARAWDAGWRPGAGSSP